MNKKMAAAPRGPEVEGEPVTLEAAIVQYRPRVAAFLSTLVDNRADVEDLTQETMLRLARNWVSYRGEGKLSSWIFRIASNVSADHYRARAVRPRGSSDGIEAMSDGSRDNESRIGRRQMSGCVVEVLKTLPQAYVEILILHDMEGLKLKAIAEKSGGNENTVKVRLRRARKRMKDALEAACSFQKDGRNTLQCEPKGLRKRPS